MSLLATMVRRSVPAFRMQTAKAAVAQRTVFWGTMSEGDPEDYVEPEPRYTKDGALIVDNVSFTLEWVLSSPPPSTRFRGVAESYLAAGPRRVNSNKFVCECKKEDISNILC